MLERVLYLQPYITISYDFLNDVIIAYWKGEQTLETVKEGCERILYHLQDQLSSKILNDNSEVVSVWDDASEWVAKDWFPRLRVAGCRLFAWVESQDVFSQLSKEKTLDFGVRQIIVTSFQNKEPAMAWLKAMR